ncbi:MAG: cobalamin biosynthesis protein [Candidatus Bathyarchaeia archaeon]
MLPFNASFFIDALLIFFSALIIDIVFGEVPDKLHPTVWMGNVIAFIKPKLKSQNALIEKVNGIFLCVAVLALFTVPIYIILQVIRQTSGFGYIIYIAVSAILLKTTIAVSSMRYYTVPIAEALEKRDLETARRWLPYIVRRDPSELGERHILSAAIESIAESTTDGITAPLLFYALLGVPGAIAFRVINTLDSMVGYKDHENIYLGWFSAKADTLCNYFPARLTALLMVVSAMFLGADWQNSWRILLRDKNKTASLNAGWTLSAMAGALNAQLEKKGHYTIGDGELVSPTNIQKALRIMELTTILFGVIVVLPILALEAAIIGWMSPIMFLVM